MKQSRNYLEVIIHHPEYSLYEYPARYVQLRIPFDNISVYDGGTFIKVHLSEYQISKLFNIGYNLTYYLVFHRPCDVDFAQIKNINLDSFKCALYNSVYNVIP